MIIDIFSLCEDAKFDGQLLSITKMIAWLKVDKLPGKLQPLCIVTRTRYERHEVGRHAFTYRIVDEDGRLIGQPARMERQAEPLGDRPYGSIVTVLRLGSLYLERFGLYACHFEVGGVELSSLPFSVLKG